MAMTINTNVNSLNAQRNLSISQKAQDTAMERLTTGKRINSAADDAAGLQIASGLTSQINGLNQAIRNANDGISLVQTAEGALDESTNILQRMRELSIQSSNGTFTSGNRDALNAEVSQLKEELTRIADTTSYNGLNILDGSLGSFDLQVGADANETINVDFSTQSFDANSLGGLVGDVVGNATTGLAALNAFTSADASNTMYVNDQEITGSLAGLTSTQSILDVINADIEDFGAVASTQVTAASTAAGDGILRAGTDTLTLSLDDDQGSTNSYVITGTNSMDELVSAINTETGGAITATLDEGKLVLTAGNNAESITVTDSTTNDTATGMDGATQFQLVFTDTSSTNSGVNLR